MHALLRFPAACAVLLALLLSACATPVDTRDTFSGLGVVQSIQETQRTSTTASAVGTVGGALVGGALGSLVGGGTGQTIATTVGAVGGAVAGNAIANKQGAETVWVVNVLCNDGINRTFTATQRPNYRPGDKVRVDNGLVTPASAK
jgi:outer membrane lipoprotein SlyB